MRPPLFGGGIYSDVTNRAGCLRASDGAFLWGEDRLCGNCERDWSSLATAIEQGLSLTPGGVEGEAQPPQSLGDKQSLLRPGLGTSSPDRVGVSLCYLRPLACGAFDRDTDLSPDAGMLAHMADCALLCVHA